MATRENQGLFIAVILLVLLTVVLAVATFFGFSGMREAADQRDSYKADLDAAKLQSDGYQAQAGILMAMLGVEDIAVNEIPTYENLLVRAGLPDLENQTTRIKDIWQKDMAKAAAGEDGSDLTYKKLISDLTNAMANVHNTQTVLQTSLDETELKRETEVAAKNAELAEKETQLAKAREDLGTEQQNHEQTRIELNTQLDDTQAELESSKRALADALSNLDNAVTKHRGELAARDKVIQEQLTTITTLEATETDVADGQIISVAPRLGKVTINLGRDDNLRLKQTFAVYDQSETRFKSGRQKAMIEITRILDAHIAEGRITSHDITNPILTRDFIVTSTWDPGYSVPVAIAGWIDLDGDGESDLQRLISIVEGVGFGKVVAYHDDNGKVTGQIDENTRFFVIGEDPLGDAADGFNRLEQQRERFQVRQISVQEFLNEMGYRNEAKVRRFEENLPSEFETRQPGGTQVESGDPFGSGN